MYNRYVRNDNGTYTRIPEESQAPPLTGHGTQNHGRTDAPRPPGPNPSPPGPSDHQEHQSRPSGNPPPSPSPTGGPFSDGLSSFLRHILDQLHLDHVDTGDLLILVLLFFLFREDADEELLVALGLLLIL